MENNNILADEQNGFRSNRSCEDHIFVLNSLIRNKANVFTAFIDLRKAFDFIDRDMLLYKLLLNKVDGKLYNSIKSIYSSSTSCIRINNKLTDWFDCKNGVKQGDNLSPTLFSVFVNDLVCEINAMDLGVNLDGEKNSLLLYADDIAIVAETELNLQAMLDKLHDWCKKWRVLINTDKSKCVHFRRTKQRRSNFEFKIGSNRLETVDRYKYLGVLFHEKLDFTHHADALAKGTGRALGAIIAKIHHLKEFGFKSFDKLYNSCVTPILDYSASTWGFKQYTPIDCVQNRAMRYFLGVHRFAPTLAMTGDTGWIPSMYRRWTSMLRYWSRILNVGGDRLLRRIFEIDYRLCNNNWCSEIKNIMNRLELDEYFEYKMLVNLDSVKHKIASLYATNWMNHVITVPKLRSYVTFKTEFKTENYLLLNLSRKERSLMAQFRCGILPLRIETGRFVGESPDERLCKLCIGPAIEDEKHFLLNCPFYNVIRNQLLHSMDLSVEWNTLNDSERLNFLLNVQTRKTAKYLVKAYCLRRSYIYSTR